MGRIRTAVLLGVAATLLSCTYAHCWEYAEHRSLGDSVFNDIARVDPLLSELKIPTLDEKQTAVEESFGSLCAYFADNDMDRRRFHQRGKTILEQLRPLSAEKFQTSWNSVLEELKRDSSDPTLRRVVRTAVKGVDNVVSSYLINHLIALRLAGTSSETLSEDARLSAAIVFESAAQGYLADAFSAAHLLVPLDDPFAGLHPRNNKEVHNAHRSAGVYVVNSSGDAWQTFGDKLMRWYAPTYAAVHDACRTSLQELLLTIHIAADSPIPQALRHWAEDFAPHLAVEELVATWLSGNIDAADYYVTQSLPSLMPIPMPVAATWSVRTDVVSDHGIHRRHQYPQLKDSGLHDPDLKNLDQTFLYSRSSIPDWLLPPPLKFDPPETPESLIRSHPDWTSVRWIQDRSPVPSFKGAILALGGRIYIDEHQTELVDRVSLGYGIWDDLMIVKNISLDIAMQGLTRDAAFRDVELSCAGGFMFPLLSWIKAIHASGGIAVGLHENSNPVGGTFALGFDSAVVPLGFTNAGATVRLNYRNLNLDHCSHGIELVVLIH